MIGERDLEIAQKRVDKELDIGFDLFELSFLGLLNSLIIEMKKAYQEEGRYVGLGKTGIIDLSECVSNLDLAIPEIPEEELKGYDVDNYINKLIYLYKPIIKKSYNKLTNRRISKGDSILLILRKIVDCIEEIGLFEEYSSYLDRFSKILNKLWGNIKHRGKNSNLYSLAFVIKTLVPEKAVGKYELEEIGLLEPKDLSTTDSTKVGEETILDWSDSDNAKQYEWSK